MATFNLRNTLNLLFGDAVPAGGTSNRQLSTYDYSGVSTAPNYLAAGAHTVELITGDRVLSNQNYAIEIDNPDTTAGYAATATFSATLKIDGVLTSEGETIRLLNNRGTSANTVTVGKDGVIGGRDAGIYAESKTTIVNNGLISAEGFDGVSEYFGNAIHLNGYAPGSNIDPKSTTTITNNAGAEIIGADHGIFFESLGALTVTNKGKIEGSQSTSDNEGAGGGVFTWDSKLTLLNDVGAYIYGTIRAGWLESKVENKGFIDGTIRAHLYGEEEGGPNSNTPLTGFIDFDRDGTPSSADAGDKHLNTITTTGITVINTGQIDGTDNWFTDDDSNPVEVAMDLTNAKDVVTNSGTVYGMILTRVGSDTVTNDVSGRIYGDVAVGGGDYYNPIGSFAGGYALDADTITNKGLITGNVFMDMGKDVFVNNGEIQGFVEVGTGNWDAANAKDEDYDTFTNTGIINGNVWMGLGDDVATNSGTLRNGLNTSAWPGNYSIDSSAWIWRNDTTSANKDFDNDKDTVTNNGTIIGGVDTGHGADKVTNNNLVDGSIATGTFTDVGNGDVDRPYSVVDLAVFQADDNDIVDNKGTVTDGIYTGLGADTVTNSGVVGRIATSNENETYDVGDPPVTLNFVIPANAAIFDKDTVTNSGTVYDWIWTGVGDDKITNAATGKVVFGGIFGGDGADVIANAGYVNQEVDGGAGSDTITNTGTIKGNVYLGTDSATNKLVNSKYIGGDIAGNDVTDAAEGNNTIENSGVIEGSIFLGSGSDTIKNTGTGRIGGTISLGGGVDTFIGNASQETILEEGGGDTYTLGAGRDRVNYQLLDGSSNTFDGGADSDWVDFSLITDNAIVNLSNLAAQSIVFSGSVSQTDTLRNFENVRAGSGNDNITGSAGANIIEGGAGTDTIIGGGGKDDLFGGADADTFVFNALTDSLAGLADTIHDFQQGLDKIDLSFIGTLTEGDFTTAATAAAAQWRATIAGGNTVLEINTDADLQADMVIYLAGNFTLTGTDFV
jgi:hypothetical protein